MEREDRGIVIFGASGGGIKVAKTLSSFGIDFFGFLDNDPQKWNTCIFGKKVMQPDVLDKKYCKIIIASEHQAEIERQLEDMGQLKNLMLKEELILPAVEAMTAEFEKKEATKQIFKDFQQKLNKQIARDEKKQRSIVIDLMEGIQLGGIESWTCRVAGELHECGEDVTVFAKKTKDEPDEKISDLFRFFDLDYVHFKEDVMLLACEILSYLPCMVIVSRQTQLLYAAYMVKKLFGNEIKIISVIHSDEIATYRRHQFIESIIDKILCVSARIKETLHETYCIEKDKLFYKESPVPCEKNIKRDYTLDEKSPIRVCYAARVVKSAKRADLIVPLILELKKLGTNFHFDVAGDGDYLDRIKEAIHEYDLGGSVALLGRIEESSMPGFWKREDIFISTSDFEGTSISMLEAMSFGVVPVVTDVSGVEEYIEQGVNGYFVNKGNVKKMAEYVFALSNDRKRIQRMGKKSWECIKEKCNPREYAKYIRNL